MIRTTLGFQWSQVHRIPINVFFYYYFQPYNLLFVVLIVNIYILHIVNTKQYKNLFQQTVILTF